MTLQSRRKRPITLRTTNQVTALRRWTSRWLMTVGSSFFLGLVLCASSEAQEWQPTRVANRQVRHITEAPANSDSATVRQAGYNSQASPQTSSPVSSAVRWQPDRAHRDAFAPEFTSPTRPATNTSVPSQTRNEVTSHANDLFSNGSPASQSVVLRWISTESEAQPTAVPATASPSQPHQVTQSTMRASTYVEPEFTPSGPAFADIQPVSNQLREEASYVRQAAYQQEGGLQFDDLPDLPPLGGSQAAPGTEPALPDVTQPFGSDSTLPELGGGNLPDLPGEGAGSGDPMPPLGEIDALDQPEAAPTPQEARPANPFLQPDNGSPSDDGEAADGSESTPDLDALPEPKQDSGAYDPELKLPDRSANSASTPSCSELRERIRQRPISNVVLNTAPVYGEGLRSIGENNESARSDFAATSPVREWRDVTNQVIAQGRMIDLSNEQVILDVGGSEIALDLIKLSDTDVKYIGDAWNIPATCGVGNIPFEGRQFVASTVQFTAPGNCHKHCTSSKHNWNATGTRLVLSFNLC